MVVTRSATLRAERLPNQQTKSQMSDKNTVPHQISTRTRESNFDGLRFGKSATARQEKVKAREQRTLAATENWQKYRQEEKVQLVKAASVKHRNNTDDVIGETGLRISKSAGRRKQRIQARQATTEAATLSWKMQQQETNKRTSMPNKQSQLQTRRSSSVSLQARALTFGKSAKRRHEKMQRIQNRSVAAQESWTKQQNAETIASSSRSRPTVDSSRYDHGLPLGKTSEQIQEKVQRQERKTIAALDDWNKQKEIESRIQIKMQKSEVSVFRTPVMEGLALGTTAQRVQEKLLKQSAKTNYADQTWESRQELERSFNEIEQKGKNTSAQAVHVDLPFGKSGQLIKDKVKRQELKVVTAQEHWGKQNDLETLINEKYSDKTPTVHSEEGLQFGSTAKQIQERRHIQENKTNAAQESWRKQLEVEQATMNLEGAMIDRNQKKSEIGQKYEQIEKITKNKIQRNSHRFSGHAENEGVPFRSSAKLTEKTFRNPELIASSDKELLLKQQKVRNTAEGAAQNDDIINTKSAAFEGLPFGSSAQMIKEKVQKQQLKINTAQQNWVHLQEIDSATDGATQNNERLASREVDGENIFSDSSAQLIKEKVERQQFKINKARESWNNFETVESAIEGRNKHHDTEARKQNEDGLTFGTTAQQIAKKVSDRELKKARAADNWKKQEEIDSVIQGSYAQSAPSHNGSETQSGLSQEASAKLTKGNVDDLKQTRQETWFKQHDSELTNNFSHLQASSANKSDDGSKHKEDLVRMRGENAADESSSTEEIREERESQGEITNNNEYSTIDVSDTRSPELEREKQVRNSKTQTAQGVSRRQRDIAKTFVKHPTFSTEAGLAEPGSRLEGNQQKSKTDVIDEAILKNQDEQVNVILYGANHHANQFRATTKTNNNSHNIGNSKRDRDSKSSINATNSSLKQKTGSQANENNSQTQKKIKSENRGENHLVKRQREENKFKKVVTQGNKVQVDSSRDSDGEDLEKVESFKDVEQV